MPPPQSRHLPGAPDVSSNVEEEDDRSGCTWSTLDAWPLFESWVFSQVAHPAHFRRFGGYLGGAHVWHRIVSLRLARWSIPPEFHHHCWNPARRIARPLHPKTGTSFEDSDRVSHRPVGANENGEPRE